MIVQMATGINKDDEKIKEVMAKALRWGLKTRIEVNKGKDFSMVEVHLLNDKNEACSVPEHIFQNMDGVAYVRRVTPSKVSFAANGKSDAHKIRLGTIEVGQGLPCQLFAGPCTVDQHIDELVGELVNSFSIKHIRGGCWKPRTSPYSFPGHGISAVKWLLASAKKHGVEAVFIEVMDTSHVRMIEEVNQSIGFEGKIVLWVGARTENKPLLYAMGLQKKFPVMMKNGLRDRSVAEWVSRAEPLLVGERQWDEHGQLIRDKSLKQGNDQILLCARGVENLDPESVYRFAPNHHWIRTAHSKYWPPIGLDPSHSAGTMKNDLVIRNLIAGLQEMPDFIMLEVYFDPSSGKQALCDAEQAVPLNQLHIVKDIVYSHNQAHYRS